MLAPASVTLRDESSHYLVQVLLTIGMPSRICPLGYALGTFVVILASPRLADLVATVGTDNVAIIGDDVLS
jgi:hypothetical protein